MFESLDFAGRAVAGQDDLFSGFVQGVEGVEELLLDSFLAGEEVDIVDQQDVRFPETSCGTASTRLFWRASMNSLVKRSVET
jgi:hypothetical protein